MRCRTTLTTNQDLKGLANARQLRDAEPPPLKSAGAAAETQAAAADGEPPSPGGRSDRLHERAQRALIDFAQFVGPGFMIAVAYSASPFRVLLSDDVRRG